LQAGDELEINGPMGYFTVNGAQQKGSPVVFIASGTGIAPFHSVVKSYPKLNYKLIHGVRTSNEGYEKENYKSTQFTLCTSQDNNSDYKGRVTNYIKEQNFEKDTSFYLCGNSEMIFDAMEILKEKGVENNKMFAEVYF
jgi:ferredoxin-NADP reductase